MEELNSITVNPVDPTTFEYQEYSEQDNNLISSSRLDTAFTSSTDYIEYYVYDNSQQLVASVCSLFGFQFVDVWDKWSCSAGSSCFAR